MPDYFYIRKIKPYTKIVKIGKTNDIYRRNSEYMTGEYELSEFIKIFEVEDKGYIVEKMVKNYFKKYHKYKGSGTEFYDIKIIDKINNYLDLLSINCKELSINDINKSIRNRELINNKKLIAIMKKYIKKKYDLPIKPYDYQNNNHILSYFKYHNIGQLLWSCGLGKTIEALFIWYKMKFKSIIIGVPTKFLLEQFYNSVKIFYPKTKILLVSGDYKYDINNYLSSKQNYKIIITTYHSSYKFANIDFIFDFKIADEAHHLVCTEKEVDKHTFDKFHKIKSKKTLFMTATSKVITNTDNCYSMDTNVFGQVIDSKSIKWAIDNKRITDYYLILLKNNEEDINRIIKLNNIKINDKNIELKELFLSAYIALKSLCYYDNLTHLLIYTNKTQNAEIIKKYIDILLKKKVFKIKRKHIYNNDLHSKKDVNIFHNDNENEECEMCKFKKAKYGIISSVYIFGEGFDMPKLNGVIFAEQMESEIRIVQSALRPNRLNKNQPEKIAYVIIPYINDDELKIKQVVRNMGNNDENIEQRIKYYETRLSKKNEKEEYKVNIKLKENKKALKSILLKLKHRKYLSCDLSDEIIEYQHYKQLNINRKVKSIKHYNKLIKKNKYTEIIKNPNEYFTKLCVWKSWYDFLGIDTSIFIQDKSEWVEYCEKLNINSLDDYKKQCKKHKCLPYEPEQFYKHFTNLSNELGFSYRRFDKNIEI